MASDFYKKLGKKIYKLRKEKKISREVFAEKAGISDYCLGEIERGEKKASIDTLFKICVILNIELHKLINV